MSVQVAAVTKAVDLQLVARVEAAGIAATAPAEERNVDGWLVRLAPGDAKRARSVQALAPGRLPIGVKVGQCHAVYEAAGLPMLFRITPFSQPPGLDEYLAASGLERIDDSRVMIATALANTGPLNTKHPIPSNDDLAALRIEPTDSRTFAAAIARTRRSSAAETQAHAARIAAAPVRHQAFVAVDSEGGCIAGAQIVVDADLVGLYDVFTDAVWRGRGIARALCAHLLARAVQEGARVGYLQVGASNDAAIHLYRTLGFDEAYAYHYRTFDRAPAVV